MSRTNRRWCALAALLGLAGCKKDEPEKQPEQEHLGPGEACDPEAVPIEESTTSDGDEDPPPICSTGLACEPLADNSGYVCGAAFALHGRVTDALDGTAIAGALIAALDDTGAPVTDVVASDSCGDYELPISIRRNADGSFAEMPIWTLFVAAKDYQPFPAGPRPALPVDFADAVEDPDGAPSDSDGDDEEEMTYVGTIIENAATNVALIPLGAEAGGVTVSGGIAGEVGAGTLVVAEGGPVPAPYGIADASGHFTIFNVPTGAIEIRGYRSGLELAPAAITIGGGDIADVALGVTSSDPATLGTVTGGFNIVNAPGGSVTSVVLVPSSVFNAALERGPVPVGLRDPPAPMSPNLSGTFTIPAVPAGTYKVLVAFENDALVRDPDAGIAGTAIQEVVLTAGQSVSPAESFKVTEALAIIGPGNDAPELVDSAMPTLTWADDSSEDGYDVIVYDALGTAVWETEIAGASGGSNVDLVYAGDALVTGMYYQFRVTSWRTTGGGGEKLYISRTEDLRGVFFTGEAPPAPECEAMDTTGGSSSSGG